MSKQKIQFISRQDLGDLLGMTRAGISAAVLKSRKLRDRKHDGKTGIDINDEMTKAYVLEVCAKKMIAVPDIFKEQKSDVQLFMDAVDFAWDQCVCGECMDMKTDFQTAVVEYVKGEKG